MSHRYGTSGKTGDAGEKSGAAKIGLEREEHGGVANGLAMELHTEGVALRRGPFSHGKAERKAGREGEGVTAMGMAVP